jgi:biopolymer transport protein ExbD
MAPLIDIVFLLIIFFMLSSSFLYPALKLTLPKAVAEQKQVQDEIIVSVDQAGSVFVNRDQIPMNRLKSELASRFSEGQKKSIHLQGDQNMPYKFFVQVMDLARQAGAGQINVVHESGQET